MKEGRTTLYLRVSVLVIPKLFVERPGLSQELIV